MDQVLRQAPPFRLTRLAVKNSFIEVVDPTLKGHPGLSLRELALTLENVTSRRGLAQGAPAVLTFRTIVEDSGEAVGFITIDPLAEEPLAAGRAALRGLRLATLNDWLKPAFKLKIPEGTFSAFVVFKLRANQLTGSIKPLIRSLELEPAASAGLWRSLGIEAADLAADLLTFELTGESDPLATLVPIRGTLKDPGVQLIPSLLGVIRDAFVSGLVAGFTTMPLDVAFEEESIFSQAAQAVLGEDWLSAQPQR